MPYPTFDRSRLEVLSLKQREHDMVLDEVLPLDAEVPPFDNPDIETIAARMLAARERGASRILMMGAHVIKVGLSRYVIAMMERGFVTHVAMNGAGPIHDFELALVGATTESVARYIRTGQFGLWKETGRINDAAKQAAEEGIGLGEAIGRMIAEGEFPHKDISILAAAHRLGIPVTVHVGIGHDIIHELPSCDGAALGAASYTDFLVITEAVSRLEGGVMLDFGSAVMGPEVYLKALAMARNVARQEGREIAHLTTAVFDLIELPENYHEEAPKTHPLYYYRPWKTILVRTVADGGESFYVRGDHRATMPNLYKCLLEGSDDG